MQQTERTFYGFSEQAIFALRYIMCIWEMLVYNLPRKTGLPFQQDEFRDSNLKLPSFSVLPN